MSEDEPATDEYRSGWSNAPSAKAKNAVQKAVTALLDALAPESTGMPRRVDDLKGTIEQHRTAERCILQSDNAALTVSWFPAQGGDETMGELHVLVWDGIVQHRGRQRRGKAATLVSEMILNPIEHSSEVLSSGDVSGDQWQVAGGGERFTTAALAAKCQSLLQAQNGSGS